MRLAAIAAAAALAFAATAAGAETVTIGTSNPGSIYHSSGSVIAKLVTEKENLRATIQPFASPNVFLPAVSAGELTLGLANVAEVRYAFEGSEHFEGRPYKDLRAVGIMYPLRVAIFVKKDSPIKTIADLKGRPMPDGFTSQKIILPLLDAEYATAGLKRSDMQAVQVPNVVAGADAFMAGKADGFFFALASAKPTEADAAVGGIRALPIENTPENLKAIKEIYPAGYLRQEKPGPANVGVTEPMHVIAYDALVVASTKTPDEVAYKIAKAMYENPQVLADGFAPFRLFAPDQMAKDIAPIEYHPGAIKFFKEKGMWPPKQ